MRKFKDVNELVNTLKPDHPVYCIRPESIKTSTEFFKKKFPGKVLYAVKTNPNEKVLKHILSNGIIALHLSIIFGIFLWTFLSGKIIDMQLNIDFNKSLAAILPFLIIKVFFEIMEIKKTPWGYHNDYRTLKILMVKPLISFL